MKLFSCSVCAEKDRRITDLKSQINLLASLTIPSNDPNLIPIVNLEADALLSGNQHTIEAHSSEMPKDEADAITSERDRLLSGTYS